MIPIKDEEGIRHMREACGVAADVLAELKSQVCPGMTTYDLDQSAKELMSRHGATSATYQYRVGRLSYPGHICVSVNEEVVHGIPSMRRVLVDGDILTLDVALRYKGYVGDNAFTVSIGNVSPRVSELLRVSEEALERGIRQARVGNRIGDISQAIQAHVEAAGFNVIRDMVGHGVGVSMHEDPQIPNFGRKGQGPKIKAGMTLAIEPMVNLGGWRTKTLSDGWTVVSADGSPSAHFEHTVLTTDHGPEILTLPRSGSKP